jgi:ECF sigma factor
VNDLPGQAEPGQQANHRVGWIDFEPAAAVGRIARAVVVVVVPALPEGQQRHPPAVPAVVGRGVVAVTPAVADRVHQKRHVPDVNDPHAEPPDQQLRDQQRHKRGGPGARLAQDAAWEEVLGREPSPDVAAEMAEAYRRLLDCLPDPELRSVAIWKMEGYSVEEMARRLDCSPRSVKRMTRLIRDLWEKEGNHE